MGVKQSLRSGGTLLGLLAQILTILSTATNYWIRYPGGHSGLWHECNGRTCSNIPCQTMLAVTGACMVLAAASGVMGFVMGLRILCHEGDSRGQTTSGIFFLYGLLLLIALTGYTVKNAWKNDVFFSWSYFSGWLALPFSIFAGNLDSGKRVEETAQRSPFPADSQPPSQGLLNTLRSRLPQTRQGRPWGPKPQSPGRSRPSAPGPTVPHPPSAPLPPGFSFLLADMIMQSTDAISGFPVCL
ncbi:claudin domain-containing protein 2 isoform X2 [Leptonychotes weddellii]|uniref:Claudin domain-containing protein 2 n=1 Tax=Leptonychotes weddellii TaxID=9713 RepID=A0A7F8RC84_LEPWE|nr:claudin domain-containing protein 2 isoform X2 [Leptonychotes weddellii]